MKWYKDKDFYIWAMGGWIAGRLFVDVLILTGVL